jgi:putative nucleotidyltransferase with HDIG domain
LNQVRDLFHKRRATALAVYAAIVSLTAAGFASGLVLAGFKFNGAFPVVLLCALALVAEREGIRLTPAVEVTVSSLPFIFAAVLFGPLAAMLVGATGLLVTFGQPYLRWTIWTASRVIVAGLSGLAATTVEGWDAARGASLGLLLAAAVAASMTEAVADLSIGAIAPSIRGTGSFRESMAAVGPLLVATLPLHTPVIAVLAYVYVHVSPWSTGLFAIPAFAAHRLFLLYRQQRDSATELAAANQRLERANLSFATALVATLDARDRYTAGHSASVAIYSRDIAERMGLGDEEQHLAHLCGLVHDIGKVGLPAGLLEKPGPLTLEERRQMERHCEIGEHILAKVDDYAEIAAVVRYHHERVDGNGYPDGLLDDEIPMLARIIAVADAYNAMTSDRPYREAMPSRVARLRVAQAVGSQFDTTVVAAFEAILATASEDYRRGIAPEFAFTQEELAGGQRRESNPSALASALVV